MSKYVFKPYNKNFPHLFEVEKKRLLTGINCPAEIEHVGSTAIPGLGGKGIIDIAIAVPKQNLKSVSKQLQSLGYEFKPKFSTSERLYFVIFFPIQKKKQEDTISISLILKVRNGRNSLNLEITFDKILTKLTNMQRLKSRQLLKQTKLVKSIGNSKSIFFKKLKGDFRSIKPENFGMVKI